MQINLRPEFGKLLSKLRELPRSRKRALMMLSDALLVPAALWVAVSLKFESSPPGSAAEPWLYICAVLVSFPVFLHLGLYRSVIRFIDPRIMFAVVGGVSASVPALALLNLLLGDRGIPESVLAIYWANALVFVGGSRFLVRSLLSIRPADGTRVAIYGAGSAGVQVLRALRVGGRFNPVAFLDDDHALQGSVIAGVEVYSPGSLPQLVNEHSVAAVLLAMPSQTRRRRQQILQQLGSDAVQVMTVPAIEDLLAGSARIEDVQDVDVADVLGRDIVTPNAELFGAHIVGKVVMVTGAGGSIGSELCRQIVRLAPQRLILFEMSEYALYQIERELRDIMQREQIRLDLTPLLGNAHHKFRVREIFVTYGVQTVYHAAAYKHVPIVEQNIIEGIHNNVIATWFTAEAALESGVETFVLISTDKAVNPTNVMGATKRLAEMVLQGLHERGGKTCFCMVRFGNVLESSGSVVPLFREQIRRGGPVTVTHPDVIRYFMTIPEASQLVLQAGSMGQGGDVFVLNMGKPMRIADLARRMIELSGLTVRDEQHPDGDIEITFTGLRPAEKLYEELLIGSNVSGTDHPMIMRAIEHSMPWVAVHRLLNQLMDAMNQCDVDAVRELLIRGVREYQPSDAVADLVWRYRQEAGLTDGGLETDTSLSAGSPSNVFGDDFRREASA